MLLLFSARLCIQDPRVSFMICLAALLARIALLLNIVRGKQGCKIIGQILKTKRFLKGFAADVITRAWWKELLSSVERTMKKCGMHVTAVAHLEGLNAGLSGLHPLKTLVKLESARRAFHVVSCEWSKVVQRMLVRGYELVTGDVLAFWNSVKNKLVLAVHEGTIKKAGKYTSMNLARVMAALATSCWGCRLATYDQQLHRAMSTGQGKAKSCGSDVGLAADEVDDSVFGLFFIPDLKAFKAVWTRLLNTAGEVGCASAKVSCNASSSTIQALRLTWQTVFVHLCECRQVLQKWGLTQLQALLKLVSKAEAGLRTMIFWCSGIT